MIDGVSILENVNSVIDRLYTLTEESNPLMQLWGYLYEKSAEIENQIMLQVGL